MDAGQEIYYSTHQFFLSERSLYLFVFDVSQPNMEQSSRIEFWCAALAPLFLRSFFVLSPTRETSHALIIRVRTFSFKSLDRLRSIRARAKNASVIVVGTHIDEKICTNNYLELRRHYVEEFCASRYPNIRVHPTSISPHFSFLSAVP